jgi:hypothetical protein
MTIRENESLIDLSPVGSPPVEPFGVGWAQRSAAPLAAY